MLMPKMFDNVNVPLGLTFFELPWDYSADIEDGAGNENANISDKISTDNKIEFDSINNYVKNIIKDTNNLCDKYLWKPCKRITLV